jgi:hypothetical protein
MQFWVPSIDYTELFVLIACIAFFAGGARMEQRSPLVWGGLSLGVWIVFTQVLFDGLAWGLASQGLLFAGLTGVAVLRERTS